MGDALMEKKEEINGALGKKREEGIAMKNDLCKMKKSIGYTTESEIDNRIASIEFKLWTESVPLKEEKKYLLEIQELKRNRPKVSKVNQLEGNLNAFRDGSAGDDLKATVGEINAAMAKHREEKKAIQEKLSKLRDERKEKLGDVPQWVDERQKLSEEIGEKVKQKNVIRDEFKAKEQEYYKYQGELRRARQEKQMEERQAW